MNQKILFTYQVQLDSETPKVSKGIVMIRYKSKYFNLGILKKQM